MEPEALTPGYCAKLLYKQQLAIKKRVVRFCHQLFPFTRKKNLHVKEIHARTLAHSCVSNHYELAKKHSELK